MRFRDKQELFFEHEKAEKVVKVLVTWGDHQPACATCRAVDVARPATLALGCAIGAPLLAEHLVNLAKPQRRAREAVVKKWASDAGFKTRRGDRKAVNLATTFN